VAQGNDLRWEDLIPLRDVAIMELTLRRNAALCLPDAPGGEGGGYRSLALALLPRVAVLDGVFVTSRERAAGAEAIAAGGGRGAALLTISAHREDMSWGGLHACGAAAAGYLGAAAVAPSRSAAADAAAMRVIAEFYERSAVAVNAFAALHPPGQGLSPLRRPQLHLRALAVLPPPRQVSARASVVVDC
jgi:hypothetical protein